MVYVVGFYEIGDCVDCFFDWYCWIDVGWVINVEVVGVELF